MNGIMWQNPLGWLSCQVEGIHPGWMNDEIDSPEYIIYEGIFILYL